MGSSPVAILVVIGIYVAIYGVIQGTSTDCGGNGGSANCGLATAPATPQPTSGGLFGWVDTLGQIITAVWNVVLLIVGALIFNVPGAPAYVQVPVAVGIIGSLSWSIATLIRGN